jgi:hypothetical protein
MSGYELCTMRLRCFGCCISCSIVCGSKGTDAIQLREGYWTNLTTWLNMVSVLIVSVRTTMHLDLLEPFGAPNSNGIRFVHNFMSSVAVIVRLQIRTAKSMRVKCFQGKICSTWMHIWTQNTWYWTTRNITSYTRSSTLLCKVWKLPFG